MSVEQVFSKIQKALSKHPEVVKDVQGVFKYNITSSGGSKSWVVDLKNGAGKVVESGDDKVDCEITLSAETFIGLTDGTVDPMVAFMEGQLKIKGDVMLAQKVQSLFEALEEEDDEKPTASVSLQAEAIFAEMKTRLSNDSSLVKKVNGIFGFIITKDGVSKSFVVDLKNGNGSVREGEGKTDCSIELADDDFVKLMKGDLDPQMAFMSGKLKVKGNIMLSQKLELLMNPKAAL